MLLRRLTSIARERDVTQFKAEVLTKNLAMLTVFSHSGLPMQLKRESGIVYVTMTLT